MRKKRILLVWWYDRSDLIAPYLKMQDDIEFTVLFYRFPEQENKKVAESLPFRRIYWTDYLSPYALIRDVRPEKLLFFGNESTLTIALIAAANVLGIPTAYVSHGLKADFLNTVKSMDSKVVNNIERYDENNPIYNKKKWHTLIFLLNLISLKSLNTVFFVFSWIYTDYKVKNKLMKLRSFQNPLRKIKHFYLYAKQNADLIKGTDNASEEQIYYTGPYLMDEVFSQLYQVQPLKTTPRYWLFIDQPILLIKRDDKLQLIEKVANTAKSRGVELVVKLHPMEYELELPEIKNVRWEKDVTNIGELIINSEACLGFYSALMLAVIPFKKTIVFDLGNSYFTNEWAEMGVVKKLNFYNFNDNELNFDNFAVSDIDRGKYIHQFVSFVDGKCTNRLKDLILHQ